MHDDVGTVMPQWQARHIMLTAPKTLGTGACIADVRTEFEDDHVHMVLIVDRVRRLLTAIDRADLSSDQDGSAGASALGGLEGRTVQRTTPVTIVAELLGTTRRRRLAVVDGDGRLRGLVCLKRSGAGYCSDQDVLARARGRGASQPARRRPDHPG